MQYAATFNPYKNIEKPSLKVFNAVWISERSLRFVNSVLVSSERYPTDSSRKDKGVGRRFASLSEW